MNHQHSLAALSPEPTSAKRQAILDAAAELFMAQGYGAVSMDAVAKAAGVSKATLYAHFGAKDRLFAAIVGGACEEMRSTAPAADAGAAADLRAALTGMARHWLTFLLRPRSLALWRVVVAEGARFPELAASFHANGPRQTRLWLAEWLAEQARAGRIAVPNPARAAEHFLALLRGDLFLRATLGLLPPPTEGEIEETIGAAVEAFHRAYPPP